MEVMEAIEKRYSSRGFADRPIEDEKLALIMEAGRLAPTASNQQRPHRLFWLSARPETGP